MSSCSLFRLKSVHKKSAAATTAAPHISGPGPRAGLGAGLGAGLPRQVSSSGSDDISTGTVSARGEMLQILNQTEAPLSVTAVCQVGITELAVAPPHVAWDPEYLLELDPRYHEAGESEDWDSEDEDAETYYTRQSDEYTARDDRR